METTREIRVPERFETETSIKANGRRVRIVFDASGLTNEQFAERLVNSTAKLGRDSWFSGKGYKDLDAIPDVIEIQLKPLNTRERAEVIPLPPFPESPTPETVAEWALLLTESQLTGFKKIIARHSK